MTISSLSWYQTKNSCSKTIPVILRRFCSRNSKIFMRILKKSRNTILEADMTRITRHLKGTFRANCLDRSYKRKEEILTWKELSKIYRLKVRIWSLLLWEVLIFWRKVKFLNLFLIYCHRICKMQEYVWKESTQLCLISIANNTI